jgi:tRNA 2-thiouridine synthesizing protein E
MAHAVTHAAPFQAFHGLPIDEDGFLVDTLSWDRDVAQRLADASEVGRLGPTHWLIIDFVRDRYFRVGAMPPMRYLCRKIGVDRQAAKTAFGSCRLAWQIAGLPNPGPEALAYMG